ncbi:MULTISPECIES: hypothetical protein [Paracoccus]|nr:hypothetical protein E3U25_03080 [Paracoccus versutus]
MAYPGSAPSKRSTGDGRITRTGNARIRSVLAKSACAHRYPAQVGTKKYGEARHRPEEVPQIAGKAQSRPTKRCPALIACGNRKTPSQRRRSHEEWRHSPRRSRD